MLLITDITGLPALGRILDEAPADQRIQAHVEIPDAGDIQPDLADNSDICWHHGFDRRPEITRPAQSPVTSPCPQAPAISARPATQKFCREGDEAD
ncbi:MAG: SIP domain-containing protein [Rhizobiales bacterium]|nr:SIP domain-containing protein [Hyphomicrobiales bacterium]